MRKLNEEKKVKHRVCPHCGKEIIPKQKKIVWHWKTYHCKCVGESSKLTSNKKKVDCCNCLSLMQRIEDNIDYLCDCGYLIESQYWRKHKFCPECGKKVELR